MNDAWWSDAEFTARLLEPFGTFIKVVQADACTQGDAYWALKDMEAHLRLDLRKETDVDRRALYGSAIAILRFLRGAGHGATG